MLNGVDISHHQNDAGPLDYGRLFTAVDFVVIKATQGTGYVDPRFAANMAAARAAGKLRGAYHFAGNNGQVPGNPVAEADHFISVAGHQRGEVLVLDWEPTKPPADPDAWCASFIARVIERTGVRPMVYMSESVARSRSWAKTRALNVGLWVARYGSNNGAKPTLTLNVGAWGGFAMWQYTSAGRVAGVTGGVDRNEFYGSATAWLAYGGASDSAPSPAAPAPVTAPAPAGDTLSAGGVLRPGQSLRAGGWAAGMQEDGNFVVYANGRPQWSTRTAGKRGAWLIMQTDGNLVLYSAQGRPLWDSKTRGKGGTRLVLQSTDGNLVIYRNDNRPVWDRR